MPIKGSTELEIKGSVCVCVCVHVCAHSNQEVKYKTHSSRTAGQGLDLGGSVHKHMSCKTLTAPSYAQ